MIYDYKRKTYLAPIKYLISHYIYEYDISKANLNILYYKGAITKTEYDEIMSYSRERRQIYFGMLQKDSRVAEILSEGVAEFRKRFIEANNINDINLLSVKNDALFLIDTIPSITTFDNVQFMKKNVYTSFYYINKLEIYYYLNKAYDTEVIDVKGIRDEKLIYHQDYMINFLCTIFESIESNTIDATLDVLLIFYKKYVNKELDPNFYREFNADSKFRISFPDGNQYLLDGCNQDTLQYVNISTNLSIIQELYSIVSSLYFNKKR